MTISEIITKIQEEILDPVITLLFVIATAIFMWGIIKYVISAGEKDIKKGRDVMLYGIIGMAVMVSAWGIVRLICEFFGTCIALRDIF